MQIFFLERVDQQKGRLNEEETRHCIQVLRHKAGDRIHAIDGHGNMYLTAIDKVHKKETWLEILEVFPEWGESSPAIHLYISPLRRKDRFEWLLEKSVELGVNRIVPVLCERSYKYRLPSVERMQSIVLSALKQCKRSRLPKLSDAEPLESALISDQSDLRMIAWCEAFIAFRQFQHQIETSSSITILIGPEGDFTPEEVEIAHSQHFEPVLLGQNRLRTETAAIFFLSAIKTICGY